MDAYDIQIYERLKDKLISNGMEMVITEKIHITKNKLSCGHFESVEHALCFVCGFEHGATAVYE